MLIYFLESLTIIKIKLFIDENAIVKSVFDRNV